ncbi:MAG: hypothetical protein Q8K60_09795, partial [Parachlamydiaceae bacterium]|nr:hypothetical protein [Parachlamydiaceae bacterium]
INKIIKKDKNNERIILEKSQCEELANVLAIQTFEIAISLKDPSEKYEMLKKSRSLGNPEAYYELGKLYLKSGEKDNALKSWDKGYENHSHVGCGYKSVKYRIKDLLDNFDYDDLARLINVGEEGSKKAQLLLIEKFQPYDVNDDFLSTVIEWLVNMIEEETDEEKKIQIQQKLTQFRDWEKSVIEENDING